MGLQLYSIREAVADDLLGMLEKVSNMGYEGVQFAGFGDHSAETVKAKLTELGIKPAGAHVPIEALDNDLDNVLKYHDTIGNRTIICPFLGEDMRTTEDDYRRTAEKMDVIGRKVAQSGFELGYHNHGFEFDTFNEKTGLDILFENTDPAHLKMELDCFWASAVGYDPLTFIDKYSDRCISLHMKDLKTVDGEPVSTELGTGTLPLQDYAAKAKTYDIKWLVVEQEHFTQDPVQSAAYNIQALKKIVQG